MHPDLRDLLISISAGFTTFAVLRPALILARRKWPKRFQGLWLDWLVVVACALAASMPTTWLAPGRTVL